MYLPPICLTATIRKPKEIVSQAIVEAIEVFKGRSGAKSKFISAGNFDFHFNIDNKAYSAPISNMNIVVMVQDASIEVNSNLKILVHYELDRDDWRIRLENRFFIRPLIKRICEKSLSRFVNKVEKWM